MVLKFLWLALQMAKLYHNRKAVGGLPSGIAMDSYWVAKSMQYSTFKEIPYNGRCEISANGA